MDLSHIKAFAFDIDGVATNGGVFCNSDGDLLRTYDAKDGFAIRMAVMNGFHVGVITGGSSESIRKRMLTSGVKPEDVFLHCRDKRIQFRQFCERYSLDPKEVMFFGDDIPDIACMKMSGCGVAPEDRDRIFDRFFTADRAHTAGKGTGLGLSICKRIMEMHGQSIRLLDTEEGAAFRFTLERDQG